MRAERSGIAWHAGLARWGGVDRSIEGEGPCIHARDEEFAARAARGGEEAGEREDRGADTSRGSDHHGPGHVIEMSCTPQASEPASPSTSMNNVPPLMLIAPRRSVSVAVDGYGDMPSVGGGPQG